MRRAGSRTSPLASSTRCLSRAPPPCVCVSVDVFPHLSAPLTVAHLISAAAATDWYFACFHHALKSIFTPLHFLYASGPQTKDCSVFDERNFYTGRKWRLPNVICFYARNSVKLSSSFLNYLKGEYLLRVKTKKKTSKLHGLYPILIYSTKHKCLNVACGFSSRENVFGRW